jgi:predicted Zn-dependent protease with MMP-like domain
LEDFETVAKAELSRLPTELAGHVSDIVIRVADFPDADVERDMELESPFDPRILVANRRWPRRYHPQRADP